VGFLNYLIEKMVDKKILVFSFVFILVIAGLIFVLANAYALATTITFTNPDDVSSAYADSDGHFTINWTNDSISESPICNWTVALWMHDGIVSVTDNANTSVYGEQDNSSWGYDWDYNNDTEANYTFSFSAFLANGTRTANSTNVSMYVDGTAPIVNWTNSGYNNETPYKKNTETLTVNVSVGDAASGVESGISYCVFNISTVANYTVMVNEGWCNSTTLNLTDLADGNHTIDVYVNDSADNTGVNLSYYVVWIDTTPPAVPTFGCTPSALRVGDSFSCSCTGSDASSGINTSYGTDGYSFTANPSTAATGTFNITCTTRDYAGNQHSASLTYTVHEALSSGGTTTTIWTHTYTPSDEQAEEGYTKELSVKNRVKLKIDEQDHYIGIVSLTETKATINISSDPVQVILAVGEDAKVDVTDDGYYDIYVLLNAIVNNKADVTIQKIHELIPEGEGAVDTTGEINGEGEEETKKGLGWWWVVIIAGVIIIAYLVSANKREISKLFKK